MQRCLEVVDDPSKITIDVMICGNSTLTALDEAENTAYGNYMRMRDMQDYYVNYDSIF